MKLNKRGETVLTISLIINAVILLGLIVWAVGQVWWVGDGYCIGSMIECHFPEEGR